MSSNGTHDGRTSEHNVTTREYSPDFPLRSPQTSKPLPQVPQYNYSTNDYQAVSIQRGRPGGKKAEGPQTPAYVSNSVAFPEASSAQIETFSNDLDIHSQSLTRGYSDKTATSSRSVALNSSTEDGRSFPSPTSPQQPLSPQVILPDSRGNIHGVSHSASPEVLQGFQYHHQRQASENSRRSIHDRASGRENNQHLQSSRSLLNTPSPQPAFSNSDTGRRGRDVSPSLTPHSQARNASSQGRKSPDTRPMSYVDLLSLPYSQQAPPSISFDHSHLQGAIGSNASLLSSKKTLEMYRANVKKTNDPAVQYSFAIFMLDAAQDSLRNQNSGTAGHGSIETPEQSVTSPNELVSEARQILQRLADKSYPFAQYYLADGFASGVFNKGKEDNDKAFPLFVAASKHGHAEAGYRAALSYEFGWGTRRDPLKAVQFYRQSASKNHPGAMVRLGRACLTGDLGLGNQYRQGVKWLKRAAESADFQYNTAPYELGILHETGYGDDIFRDETYAAQLFTQSADLGHAEASFRLGDAYEHGKLSCPRDPALSVHFYNGAASRGHPQAMMALCAWYMVGAEPVLDKDENEAYEWAKRAAECGLPKAEYAVGYFTEMGIGCRRDPLEANVWYVKAADQGDQRAKHRIAAIQAAASGGTPTPAANPSGKGKKAQGSGEDKDKSKSKKWGLF